MILTRILLFMIFMGISIEAHSSVSNLLPKEAVWVEATGEILGGDDDPPLEVRERAKSEAKRKALEEALGSFIRSHTLVSNGQLAEEMTYARVRGTIDKIKDVVEERDKDNPNLWRVKLKALVKPVYPQEGEGIHIKMDLSKSILNPGEEVRIHYQVNSDSFVYIFSIASDKSVTMLFPNEIMKDNFIKANAGHTFPPEHSAIRLKAFPLPGVGNNTSEERVKLIATRHREILLEKGFQEGMFQVYDAKSTGLVGDLARKLNQLDPADWGEALNVYFIQPHK